MKTSTILLAGLAALCAVPAVAETTSVPVSFAGLDLTSPAGKAVLDRRVNLAVRQICGIADGRDLNGAAAVRKCSKETLAQARPRVAIAVASSQRNIQVAALVEPVPGRSVRHAQSAGLPAGSTRGSWKHARHLIANDHAISRRLRP